MPEIHTSEGTSIDENRNMFSSMIEQEKIVDALQLEKRYEEFRQILDGTQEEEVSKKYIFYVFGTIVLVYFMTCYLTLIPVANVIKNPQHWFEQMLHIYGLFCPVVAGHYIFMCSFLITSDTSKHLHTGLFFLWLDMCVLSLHIPLFT